MDLGKYSETVIWSYVGALGMIMALVAVSLWQAARTRRALREAEARIGQSHG